MPGFRGELDTERWKGRLLGLAALVVLAGAIVLAVLPPDIRDSAVVTQNSVEESPRPRFEDESGAGNHDHVAIADVGKTSGSSSNSIPQQAGVPAENQEPASMALVANEYPTEPSSPEPLLPAAKSHPQRSTDAVVTTMQAGLEDESSDASGAVEQSFSHQPTEIADGGDRLESREEPFASKEQRVDTGARIEEAVATAAVTSEIETDSERKLKAPSASPSDTSRTKKGGTAEISAITARQPPGGARSSNITVPGLEVAEAAKTTPPAASTSPRVGEATSSPPVRDSAPRTVPVPAEAPTLASSDAPVLLAKTTSPQKEITSIEDLNLIKSLLLGGKWKSRDKPAVLLPSEVTFCKSEQDEINCWSIPQDINTKYGKALYKVEGTLQDFSEQGDFQVSYRTLVKLARDNDVNLTDSSRTSGDTPWRITEHVMSCHLVGRDSVQCRDEKGVTRHYRRFAR